MHRQALSPVTNEEIAKAKDHWEAKHDKSLVDLLTAECSGGLKDLIVGLITGKRDESEEIDEVGSCFSLLFFLSVRFLCLNLR